MTEEEKYVKEVIENVEDLIKISEYMDYSDFVRKKLVKKSRKYLKKFVKELKDGKYDW